MKKILLGIALLCLVASTGYCQEQTQPLQLTIKSDKQVYAVGEEIKIEATFKNNSDKEMIVFWNNEKPVLSAAMSGQIGVAVVSIPSEPVNNIETLYIKPKATIEKKLSIENNLVVGM